MIDRKIEHLLETYKKQDEEILRKAQEKEQNKSKSKRILRDKFGFSDDEGDNDDNTTEKQLMKIANGGSYTMGNMEKKNSKMYSA